MAQRIVEDEFDRDRLLAFIAKQEPPFTVNVSTGGRRSIAQNRLIHLWMGEIAEQLPGTFESPEQVRGYSKLHFGVPILREVDEHFREVYDKQIKPLPYDLKIACMMEPIALPVTSRMNTKQLSAYLDAVHREFSTQGVELTIPEDKSLDWRPTPPVSAYVEENA
jgi:hypothetical protein|tara:strand:+ start:3830 stop:4324 length:495 start_codon:yes stop_codon:yes gene_type:complete